MWNLVYSTIMNANIIQTEYLQVFDAEGQPDTNYPIYRCKLVQQPLKTFYTLIIENIDGTDSFTTVNVPLHMRNSYFPPLKEKYRDHIKQVKQQQQSMDDKIHSFSTRNMDYEQKAEYYENLQEKVLEQEKTERRGKYNTNNSDEYFNAFRAANF